MVSIVSSIVSLMLGAAVVMADSDVSVLSPLLTSTLTRLRLERRTARVRFASQTRFCRDSVPEKQQEVSAAKQLVKSFEDDIARNTQSAEDLWHTLVKPLQKVRNANGDVKATSWVRGMEHAQYLSSKQTALKMAKAGYISTSKAGNIEDEEKGSQLAYDALMTETSQSLEDASHMEVATGIEIGRIQQKNEDNRAALRSARSMLEDSESNVKHLIEKCVHDAASFRAKHSDWNSRIEVLEKSLGVAAGEALPAPPLPLKALKLQIV